MYNRYLENAASSSPCVPDCQEQKTPECIHEHSGGLLSSLSHLLNGKQISKLLDENTLLVLLLLYFLLKDDDGIDHDILILAGVFLLLGL